MSGKVYPLRDNQLPAADPAESVWLSASAGTGKTQVLSARVLRLLLEPGTDPSQILCLTFTRAGAAEMAVRINEVLARWVRLPDALLAKDLLAIGADHAPETIARARTLFARVLDCPGGGLRIDTIHAFAQWLLAAFPAEAGLVPGVRAMEDRDRDLLLREVLSGLLLDAEARGDGELLDALALLSLRLGPDKVPGYLLRCAEAREAWEGTGAWQPPLRARVEGLLGLPAGADEAWLAGLCADEAFDVEALRACMAINAQWKAATGQDGASVIGDWLSSSPKVRLAGLEGLAGVFLTKAGTVRAMKSQVKIDPAYADHVDQVCLCLKRISEGRTLIALADFLTPALTLGWHFARAWAAAKAREGFIDFDDQICQAAALLERSGFAEWIRYKLDRRFDHVLVDEAQDTNAAQWRIIDAITDDFFAGQGAKGDRSRTLFVVGDYKQAIFRFQGTSPENFEAARKRVKARMAEAAANAEALRANLPARKLQELGLGRSYRTAQDVLDFVNRAIGHLGHRTFGLSDPAEPHVGDATRPGHVAFWRPIGVRPEEAEDAADEAEEGGEGWLSKPDRQLADRIARQVRLWLDEGFVLHKGRKRRAGPGDVMILVRKRRELAGLIVARLHAAGVPVAGVDRLRLGAPLAVRDLLAALRFAAQPLDDLTLASLLVSPLIGWSQEQLLEHGYRPRGEPLWQALRRSRHPDAAAVVARLVALLNRADVDTPQALLHWLLTGEWDARRRLVARLGREANDPVDELVNAAHAHASAHVPSLTGFLHWFDAGEGELKREAGRAEGLVQVMTVHGSKGLQRPIVILADAAGDPKASRAGGIDLPDVHDDNRVIPLPALAKEERVGRIRDAADKAAAADMEEHWRLLYVAMTRAEEALFVTGSLTAKEKEPASESWYARLVEMFPPDAWRDDPLWGGRLEHGPAPTIAAGDLPAEGPAEEAKLDLPDWLERPAAAEPRPPRPLAPSALGEDQSADPPWPPGSSEQAARRGTLIHRLLERLPELPEADREQAAQRWLARNGADMDQAARADMAQAALSVLAAPEWADLFGPDSLAEVPLAATVGGQVIAGTIDRLLIGKESIRLVDFKTARRPPADADEVPKAILRQMAAYVAALEAIHPGRRIEAGLLYTQAPRLIALPADLLDRLKPGLG